MNSKCATGSQTHYSQKLSPLCLTSTHHPRCTAILGQVLVLLRTHWHVQSHRCKHGSSGIQTRVYPPDITYFPRYQTTEGSSKTYNLTANHSPLRNQTVLCFSQPFGPSQAPASPPISIAPPKKNQSIHPPCLSHPQVHHKLSSTWAVLRQAKQHRQRRRKKPQRTFPVLDRPHRDHWISLTLANASKLSLQTPPHKPAQRAHHTHTVPQMILAAPKHTSAHVC